MYLNVRNLQGKLVVCKGDCVAPQDFIEALKKASQTLSPGELASMRNNYCLSICGHRNGVPEKEAYDFLEILRTRQPFIDPSFIERLGGIPKIEALLIKERTVGHAGLNDKEKNLFFEITIQLRKAERESTDEIMRNSAA